MQQKAKETFGILINGFTIAIYFILLAVLDVPPAPKILPLVGLILLVTGIAFIILTIITLSRKHTDAVISSGVFALVRHPLYLGAIFLYLAMVCFLPHWLMLILAIVNILYIYWFMAIEEQKNREKFGSEYAHYMQSVPRANLFAGILRLLQNKRSEK